MAGAPGHEVRRARRWPQVSSREEREGAQRTAPCERWAAEGRGRGSRRVGREERKGAEIPKRRERPQREVPQRALPCLPGDPSAGQRGTRARLAKWACDREGGLGSAPSRACLTKALPVLRAISQCSPAGSTGLEGAPGLCGPRNPVLEVQADPCRQDQPRHPGREMHPEVGQASSDFKGQLQSDRRAW